MRKRRIVTESMQACGLSQEVVSRSIYKLPVWQSRRRYSSVDAGKGAHADP